MTTLQNVDNVQFRVETLVVHNGTASGRLRKDDSGYYTGVPIAALGIPSRNRTYYDVQSFSDQIQNPSSTFNMRLTGGQLYGEWGHPTISDLDERSAMVRLSEIREKEYSHHFKSINTGKTLSDGGIVLEATLKPTGPFSSSLEQNLEDPCMNTAFSLRAITKSQDRDGLSWRTTIKLITFDAVGAGGFFQASKIFSSSLESLSDVSDYEHFDVVVTPMETAVFTETALENYTNTEINDIFGAKTIQKVKHIVTLARTKDADPFSKISSLKKRSLFHEKFKG